MLILVSNDDGFFTDGIKTLAKKLREVGEVWVVAPDREQSATGHSLTLHRPLRVKSTTKREDEYMVDGTPTDCVSIGANKIMPRKPDIIVSGINRGANLGDDVTYSGTVAAALEGALLGIPAIAMSAIPTANDDYFYEAAADFAAFLAVQVMEKGLAPSTILNVNVPSETEVGDHRCVITRMGKRVYSDVVEEKIAELKTRPSVTGADLLPLVVELGALRQIFETVHELTSLIRAHRGKENSVSETPLKDTLYNLVRRLKLTSGKEVQLDTALFDESRLPLRMTRLAQEIFIQMIRNSFAHGIEDTTERLRAGKKATGLISLGLKETDGVLKLRYSDDGAGLDAAKLRAKAVAEGIVTAEEIAGWQDNRVYALIFRKGLSTAESVGQDAGRGVGMDIIQENVRQLKGRTKLRTKPGKGVEFVFEFETENRQDKA